MDRINYNTKRVFDNFVNALKDMAVELEPGQVTEFIEYTEIEQQDWKENSSGWKVLEAFKEFVRDGVNNG